MIASSDGPASTVVIIEDDEDVRESLDGLFRSVGLAVAAFASVRDYSASGETDRPGCIVLDVRLPGISGLDFQDELVSTNCRRSLVFISGHADIAMSVRAMKAGAIEFLTKPVRDQDLLDAVRIAIERDGLRRRREHGETIFRAAYEMLTGRERDIMAHVATGRRNKQIAADLGVTEATVKLHRGNVMQKMNARSLVDLVRMSDILDLATPITRLKDSNVCPKDSVIRPKTH